MGDRRLVRIVQVEPRPLQFGHGGDAVGDPDGKRLPVPGRSRLQFGHGGDAVGDSLILITGAIRSMLQFGHGGDAVGDR